MVPLDFTALSISPSIFEGVDAFFFMTPLIDDPLATSLRVLDAAIDGGVRHIVRLSSRSVAWDQETPLRAWHREIEGAVQASSATWTILRPCSHFQNFIRDQAESIKSMSAVIAPQGDGLIPYIDAADVGEAAARCMMRPDEHDGEIHVLTGARAYGVKGVAAEIGRVIGKPVTYINVDEDRLRDMMLESGAPEWLIEARLAVFAHAKAGGEAAVDPTLAEILGRPAASLSEFVERNRSAWL
jgi:uncharacterized protein YbjT (DUF2867 family)